MTEETQKRQYLGDGLYAHYDGFQVWLTAPQGGGSDHSVALESNVLDEFLRFIEKTHHVKIMVSKAEGDS